MNVERRHIRSDMQTTKLLQEMERMQVKDTERVTTMVTYVLGGVAISTAPIGRVGSALQWTCDHDGHAGIAKTVKIRTIAWGC